ncbi:hypothetical protein [Allonocardiopsis opalescens]|uniref:Uncharacterized protein n=1 Tax=Allonocardiopsis opalescens TaxID=1144618 RepID=A0A2T0QCG2_9ACTN|nr:hypothetical protein [Allonocardiopsis opalescens]PRY01607.1 hypothetical protein CLV72_101190 [Allonocardiopsis opalescens]
MAITIQLSCDASTPAGSCPFTVSFTAEFLRERAGEHASVGDQLRAARRLAGAAGWSAVRTDEGAVRDRCVHHTSLHACPRCLHPHGECACPAPPWREPGSGVDDDLVRTLDALFFSAPAPEEQRPHRVLPLPRRPRRCH